jgi:hypothetical protein
VSALTCNAVALTCRANGSGSWIIAGFVCEFYGAPGDMGFGLGKEWDAAEQSCADNFGGHLVPIGLMFVLAPILIGPKNAEKGC